MVNGNTCGSHPDVNIAGIIIVHESKEDEKILANGGNWGMSLQN